MGKDEDSYRWLSALNAVAMQRYRERNIAGLQEILQKFVGLLKQTDDDPRLSTLETATAQCILMLAESYLDDLYFEDCLELCAEVQGILEAKAARYIARCQKPRPDSLAWARLTGILGDAKWKGPDGIQNRVLALGEMIRLYKRAEVSVHAGLARHRRAEKAHRSLVKLMACCGVQLIRALMRFQPAQVGPVKDCFVKYHGDIIDDPCYPYYWSQRICALYLDGCRDRQQYEDCYRGFRQALINETAGSIDLTAYDESSSRELAYLLKTARNRRAVITFRPT